MIKQVVVLLAVIVMAFASGQTGPAPDSGPEVPAAGAGQGEPAGDERVLDRFWFTCGGYLPPQSYEIVRDGDGYVLARDDEATARMDQTAVDSLMGIIGDYGLYAWDGFNESAQYVLDGEGFGLSVSFSDGTTIEASGDNAFPPNYQAAVPEIMHLLDTALDGNPAGIYRYGEEGGGDGVTITIAGDGTFTFRDGGSEGYEGAGSWFAERKLIYMSEEDGMDLHFYFLFVDDKLTYMGPYSDPFPFTAVEDGCVFTKENGPDGNAAGDFPAIGEISEFYYTLSASTDPPHYQRYRFYTEDGELRMYHETREGGGWPQTEEDITASGTVELTEEERAEFFRLVSGGTVRDPAEEDDPVDGDEGPWTYLYRNGEQMEYAFPSYGARVEFEEFCESLSRK